MKIVLAYSGGLDTSVLLKQFVEQGHQVVAMTANLGESDMVAGEGSQDALEAARRKALGLGAIEAVLIDARERFVSEYGLYALAANALYQGVYPLSAALSRPLIADLLVETAAEHGADAVAHGCTGKGNDQVRFEVSVRALAPDLEVLAPVRVWGFTRDDSIDYAAKYDIPINVTKKSPYSVDENLWGRTVECGILEDPWVAPPEDVYELTKGPVPAEPREMVISFEEGVPTALDGVALSLPQLVQGVTEAVGPYGWGRIDMVENRRVGIKSREIYECPGSLALIIAHADLESITVERDLMREKARLEPRYAELVYDGLWYSPLKDALDAFIASSQQFVTGDVRLHLAPGQCFVAGRRAPRALYDYELATYEAADRFRHEDAAGFVRLWGLSVETVARRQGSQT
jgi:argininosuccinate synthase